MTEPRRFRTIVARWTWHSHLLRHSQGRSAQSSYSSRRRRWLGSLAASSPPSLRRRYGPLPLRSASSAPSS